MQAGSSCFLLFRNYGTLKLGEAGKRFCLPQKLVMPGHPCFDYREAFMHFVDQKYGFSISSKVEHKRGNTVRTQEIYSRAQLEGGPGDPDPCPSFQRAKVPFYVENFVKLKHH